MEQYSIEPTNIEPTNIEPIPKIIHQIWLQGDTKIPEKFQGEIKVNDFFTLSPGRVAFLLATNSSRLKTCLDFVIVYLINKFHFLFYGPLF